METPAAAGSHRQAAGRGGFVRAGVASAGGFFHSLVTERAALLLCVFAGLVPIWSVDRFPSVDGPIHLYIMFLLERIAEPGENVFHQLFVRNSSIEPNLAVYGILWVLSRAVPILVAEKLFVSGYWVIFALSSWYLMRAFGAGKSVLGLLLLPFALGFFVHYGFYNFVLGQALFLFACGYALRRLDRLTWPHIAILSVLMLALALTHLVGIAMFLFFIGLARGGVALRAWRSADGAFRDAATALTKDALRLALAAFPALYIMASFYLRHVVTDDSAAPQLSLMQKIQYIGTISPIFSIDKREALALAPFILTIWALALKLAVDLFRDRSKILASAPILLPLGGLVAIISIGSLTFAAFDALPRLLPFMFFMLIMAFGIGALNSLWRAAIILSVTFGIVASAVLHLGFYRQINRLYEGYAAAREAPPPGAIVFGVNMAAKQNMIADYSTGWRMNMTGHFRETYARENGLPLLSVELLAPQIFGYFPVTYRPHVEVAAALSDDRFAGRPEPLRHFEATTGLAIDQIEFWPRRELWQRADWLEFDRVRKMTAELERRWRPVQPASPLAPTIYVKADAPQR